MGKEANSWSMILGVLCLVAAFGTLIVFEITDSRHRPNYAQVCAPLRFFHKVDYYHGRTFVVCGSLDTEPVLKEYLNEK